ncbi:MAG: DNA methyltransferase, partial [Gammaproteobacteria bacterium]|nr:DNA methyltransferase [Gammaproteobacteria bacterium]
MSTVEKIDPAAWVGTLRRQSAQPDLFASFDRYENPERAKWEWYEHSGNWQNRLIHAAAKRAMASLLEHEHMAGEVQCIYFDPPYGMDFDARYMDDTVQVTAFRDSYEGGVHTYLDGIREVALLGRELLSETGSFFMQIGDVNVHRCAMVLDEVFGPENRVTTIMYATGGGGSSTRSIPKAGDFILWYAKDLAAPMIFQMLYEAESLEAWCDRQTYASGIDLPNGRSRPLTVKERRDPERSIPPSSKLWSMPPLLSQNASEGEQGQPFVYQGVQYGPKGLEKDQWRVDQDGLQYLAKTNRLWSNVDEGTKEAGAGQLRLKVYRDELPGKRITNHWSATISPSDKRYAVQTGDLAIQRCMLMTTKPGDLVLDPTGGSGTTALIAERWGRRWISIDSSRESIAVTRERVLVHDYPRHLLIGSEEGFQEEQSRRAAAGQSPLAKKPEGELDPATGFVVERMPYVSAATLAYAERPDKQPKRDVTWLVDHPAGRPRGRVCSRFTVETELMEVYQRPDDVVRP